jgi:hypothetical protein
MRCVRRTELGQVRFAVADDCDDRDRGCHADEQSQLQEK